MLSCLTRIVTTVVTRLQPDKRCENLAYRYCYTTPWHAHVRRAGVKCVFVTHPVRVNHCHWCCPRRASVPRRCGAVVLFAVFGLRYCTGSRFRPLALPLAHPPSHPPRLPLAPTTAVATLATPTAGHCPCPARYRLPANLSLPGQAVGVLSYLLPPRLGGAAAVGTTGTNIRLLPHASRAGWRCTSCTD